MSETTHKPGSSTGAQMRRFAALEDILMGFSDGIDGARLQAGLMWAKTGNADWQRKDLISLFAAPWRADEDEAEWQGDWMAQGEKDLDEVTAAALGADPGEDTTALLAGVTLRHHDGRTGTYVCTEEDGRYCVQSLKGKGFWVFHADDCRQVRLGYTLEQAWESLLEKDDRNSPADRSDMLLITQDELADFMGVARLQANTQPGRGDAA